MSLFACNFCRRQFTTKQGLSSHYKIHKNLPPQTWLKHGPARSKIKTAFSRARREGPRRERRARALSPVPLRAVKWVGPYCYELPWLTQGAGGPTNAAAPPPDFRVMDPIPGGLVARRGYGYGFGQGVPNGERSGTEESEETSSDFTTEDKDEDEDDDEDEEADSSVE